MATPITTKAQLTRDMITAVIVIVVDGEVIARPTVIVNTIELAQKMENAQFFLQLSNVLTTLDPRLVTTHSKAIGMSAIVTGVSKVRRSLGEIAAKHMLNHDVIDLRINTYSDESLQKRINGIQLKSVTTTNVKGTTVYVIDGLQCDYTGTALNNIGDRRGMETYNGTGAIQQRKKLITNLKTATVIPKTTTVPKTATVVPKRTAAVVPKTVTVAPKTAIVAPKRTAADDQLFHMDVYTRNGTKFRMTPIQAAQYEHELDKLNNS